MPPANKQKPSKNASPNYSFYCDVCERVFRILRDDPQASGKNFTVACPTCGRRGRVERLPDGGLQIIHKEHVFICPPVLTTNPVIVLVVCFVALVGLIAVLAAVALWIHPLMCPIVFTFALLFLSVFGAIYLALVGKLTNNFVGLMRVFYKVLPSMLGKQPREGNIVHD
jgi:hypothetical protein